MPSLSNFVLYSARDFVALLVMNMTVFPCARSAASTSFAPGTRRSPCQRTPSQSKRKASYESMMTFGSASVAKGIVVGIVDGAGVVGVPWRVGRADSVAKAVVRASKAIDVGDVAEGAK